MMLNVKSKRGIKTNQRTNVPLGYYWEHIPCHYVDNRTCFGVKLSSGPKKKSSPTLPEPVHVVSDPGPAWHINCNYEPEPDLNRHFVNMWAVITDVLNYSSELFELQKSV